MLQIAITQPSTCAIKRFETMKDDTHDSTYLFITDSKWNQWRLLLERRTTGYTWCSPFLRCNTERHKTESRNETSGSIQREKEEKDEYFEEKPGVVISLNSSQPSATSQEMHNVSFSNFKPIIMQFLYCI